MTGSARQFLLGFSFVITGRWLLGPTGVSQNLSPSRLLPRRLSNSWGSSGLSDSLILPCGLSNMATSGELSFLHGTLGFQSGCPKERNHQKLALSNLASLLLHCLLRLSQRPTQVFKGRGQRLHLLIRGVSNNLWTYFKITRG